MRFAVFFKAEPLQDLQTFVPFHIQHFRKKSVKKTAFFVKTQQKNANCEQNVPGSFDGARLADWEHAHLGFNCNTGSSPRICM